MDRPLIYPGQIPLDTDILSLAQATGIALGWLAQCLLADTQTVGVGLSVGPTDPPSMNVKQDAGCLLSQEPLEPNAYGSILADNTSVLMKMGINVSPITLGPFAAPGTPGQSVKYIVQAAFQESDAVPVVLPYVDASNPSVPFSGPANTAAAQFTRRIQRVNIQIKEGTPATSGSETQPAADAGYAPLFVITIPNGTTAITGGMIALAVGAPPPLAWATLFGGVLDKTSGRALNTVYHNTTIKPIMHYVTVQAGGGACAVSVSINGFGTPILKQTLVAAAFASFSFIVPATNIGPATFSVDYTGTAPTIIQWTEQG